MAYSALLVLGLCLCTLSTASYVLEDNYAGNSFFNGFSFFTSPDPTNGYVTYVSASTATQNALTSVSNNQVFIYSDHTNIASGSGRNSVRIVSNKQYTGGLFLFDMTHMPFGCGTWPAVWTVGPNWPNNGEIDVIEGVNVNTVDSMTLHTSSNCNMPSGRPMTGTAGQTTCDVSVNGNAGCGVSDTRTTSYGANYNANGGGVHAMLWNNQSISVWFFPRSSIPADITAGTPNPSGWSTPAAFWPLGSNCDPSHFADHQIVVDNTFCGDWAGNVFSGAGCGSSCTNFVQNNPGNFSQSYWAINSFKVYQPSSSSVSPTSSPVPTISPNATLFPQYIGCYVDSTSHRDLPYQQIQNAASVMTVQLCEAACKAALKAYAGLQYGQECWCGNSFGNSGGKAAASDCNMPCKGNSSEICGAGNRNSIYQVMDVANAVQSDDLRSGAEKLIAHVIVILAASILMMV